MADYTESQFPGDVDLAAQALNAVRAGADPDAVRKMFLEEAAKRGADPSKLTTSFIDDSPAAAKAAPAVDKATKKQYQDVISGAEPWDLNVAANRTERRDDGLRGLIAPTIQKNSPFTGNLEEARSKFRSSHDEDVPYPSLIAPSGVFQKESSPSQSILDKITSTEQVGLAHAGASIYGVAAATNVLAAAPTAVFYDAIASQFGGDTTKAQDWVFKNLVDPASNEAKQLRAGSVPKGVAEKTVAQLGDMAGPFALMMATRNPELAELAGPADMTVLQNVSKVVSAQMPGAATMTLPSVTEKAMSGAEEGKDFSLPGFLGELGEGTAMATAPFATSGRLAKRLAQGGAASTAISAAHGETDPGSLAASFITGAGMGMMHTGSSGDIQTPEDLAATRSGFVNKEHRDAVFDALGLPKTAQGSAAVQGMDFAKSLTGDIDFSKDEPIPAPKKTNEAKQRERDEIKTRADALGVSVKEYKEATGYSEETPNTESPLITKKSNANGDFIHVGDQGAGVTYELSHSANGVFQKTRSGDKQTNTVLNEEGDWIDAKDANKISPHSSERPWAGPENARQFIAEQAAKSQLLDDPHYKARSQLIQDLVTDKISLEEARTKAESLSTTPKREAQKSLADQLKEAESRRSVLDDDNLTLVAPQLPAYHGTPHDVDQFSTKHIGTGEGNQSFGYGLYFAGNEKVADHYRQMLADNRTPENIANYYKEGDVVPSFFGQDRVVKFEPGTRPGYGGHDWRVQVQAVDKQGRPLEGIDGRIRSHNTPPSSKEINEKLGPQKQGNLYKVELQPQEHEYLSWDKPLNEQPEGVQAALKKAGVKMDKRGHDTGATLYRDIAKTFGDKAASDILHENGIPGIKYLDHGSRKAGGGEHNYVIFKDKDVAITHKNGEPVQQTAPQVKVHGGDNEKVTRGSLLDRPGYYQDEKGFIYDDKNNLVAQPKETARPSTQAEIEPHMAPAAQRALKAQAHEALNKAGNAHAVLDILARGKDDIAALAKRVMATNDLSGTKFTAVNPEDLLTSRSGNAQSLISDKRGGHVLGLRGLHDEGVFVRGAGFKINGLDRVTVMHEILHVALQDKIRAAAKGLIKDPAVIKAIHELENMRDALQRMDSSNPRRPAMFDHAMLNIDELTSISGTDHGFRDYLKKKTVGEVSAWSKLKDIWRRVLGVERMNKSALDHVMDHINTLVDYRHEGNEPSANKAAYSVKPKEEEKLQKPRGRTVQGVKEAFASGGIEPKVAAAEQAKQGLIAEGAAEAVQAANRLGAVVTKANKDLVSRSLAGDVTAFKQLDPKTREVVRDEYKRNFDRSLAIVKEIDSNPNASPEMKAIAAKILENAGKYQMDVYTAKVIPRSMKDKYALAQKARKKLADGKKISDQEREALNHVDEAKKFLEQYYLPDTEKLKTFKTPHLEDLYHYYTGKHADEALGSFETKALRKEALMGEIAKGMRDTVNRSGEVENLLKNVMGIGDKASSLHTYYNNMRAGSDIYSVHTKVPEALKQLWEPVLDPVARNVASIRQQYNYIANLHSQNMLAKDGMGTIFTKERGHATHNARIEGSKMGALQGLYTTPDVKRALDSIFTLHSMTGDALDSLVASRTGTEFMLNRIKWLADKVVAPAASFTKLMSVVGNAGNYANNFVGSAAQIMANGNINPVAMAKGMRDAAQMIGIGLKKNMSESVRDLFKYRIAEYSHIAELKGSEHTNMVQSILKRSAEAANPLQALQQELSKVVNGGRHGAAIVKELYGAMDFWTKAANWHNELGFWKDHFAKIGQKMTDDELKQFVAQRVNATNITPSAAGKLFRGLERYGITRFGTYYAEVARTLKNNIGMGVSDMADGIRLMNTDKTQGAKLFLHGAKRFAGASGAIVAHNQHFALMAKGIAGAMGLVATQMSDDDPVKKYMQKDDFLGSMDPLLLTDPQHPEDGTFVYDLSHADPFGPITMPVKTALGALIKATDGKDPQGAKDMMDQFVNQTKGLYLSNALWSTAAKIMKGSPSQLEKQNPELYNKISEWLTTAGFEVPGANRAINAATSVLPKSVSNLVLAANPEIVSDKLKDAIAAGVGVSKMDVAGDISNYMSGKATTDINAAKGNYASLMRQDYKSSPERLEASYVKGLKEAAEPYEKMRTAVKAAKALGTNRVELMRRMKTAGISEAMAYNLLEDKPISVDVLNTDLKKDFQRDLIKTIKDPAKQKEAMERYIYNTQQLVSLKSKYRDKNIEELQ